MSVLYLVESTLNVINELISIFCNFYYLILTIGHIGISLIIKTVWLCIELFNSSANAFNILKEDFQIFKNDLMLLFSPLLKAGGQFLVGSCFFLNQVNEIILTFYDGLNCGIKSLCNHFLFITIFIENIFSLVIDALCLIGTTFFYFTRSFSYIFTGELYNALATELKKILEESKYIFKIEALLGLLIVLTLAVLSVKSGIHLKFYKICRNFLILVPRIVYGSIVIFSLLIFKTMWEHWKNAYNCLKPVILKRNIPSHDTDLQRLLEQEKAEKLCVICMDRKRNIMLMYCQHLVLCNVCVSALLEDNGLCPICRRVIADVIVVYT